MALMVLKITISALLVLFSFFEFKAFMLRDKFRSYYAMGIAVFLLAIYCIWR